MDKAVLDEVKERSEIYKLIVAKDAISQAMVTAHLFINNEIDKDHLLYRQLHDALVVNYGKAFSSMNPFGTIDKKWSIFTDEMSEIAHKAIINQRNKMVGHRDFIPEGVMIYQKGVEMPLGEIATSVKNEILHKFIAPDDIKFVAVVSADLITRMTLEISDRMKAVYGEDGEKIEGALELMTEDDVELIKAENDRLRKLKAINAKN